MNTHAKPVRLDKEFSKMCQLAHTNTSILLAYAAKMNMEDPLIMSYYYGMVDELEFIEDFMRENRVEL